jgi:hypothetical protein
MGIEDLYQDYSIETAPPGNRHARIGWVNTECPHCSGSFGYHLGFNISFGYFYCWRCGPHNTDWTVSKLLKTSYAKAKEIAIRYRLTKGNKNAVQGLDLIRIGKNPIRMPSGCEALSKQHVRYLKKKRKFDPEYLVKQVGS